MKTLGCQANTADSLKIAGILEAIGYEEYKPQKAENEMLELEEVFSNADLFIINTCSVRQKSEDKAYGLGKTIKRIGKKPIVVMSGCLVGSAMGIRKRFEFESLRKKTPWVDIYLNPSQINELPEMLKVDQPPQNYLSKTDTPRHAYINISTGCDNFCTYCVVPYARGKEISRTQEEIIEEVKTLTDQGIAEFTLCGQNVNSWGLSPEEKFEIRTGSDQKLPFATLLRKVHEMPGVEKIEFISSNPFDFTQDLIDAIKLPKISKYIHIAVQSGNNEVLKRMNRRHTIEQFLDLVQKIQKAKPGIEIGTDLIVGFPGETEEQFMDTIKLVNKVPFAVAFIAMYSERPGTFAAKNYPNDIPYEEKKRRHSLLTQEWKKEKARTL